MRCVCVFKVVLFSVSHIGIAKAFVLLKRRMIKRFGVFCFLVGVLVDIFQEFS